MRIGVAGAGHLGKIHIKCIQELAEVYELVGFYDTNEEARNHVADQFGIKAYEDIDAFLNDIDIIDIVTPTIYHFDVAKKAILKGKHVFVEKPITNTIEEAEQLLELSKEANVKIQVGHVERFNPAFKEGGPMIKDPMFIETHRLAQFNPRGTDVSVVLDLMIHDIDIILSVVNSPVKSISATGVPVISTTPDITNARIEFENGAIANLTASRISMKNMRKSRFFQNNTYISVDFLEKEFEMVNIEDYNEEEANPFAMVLEHEGNQKVISIHKPEIQANNAIKDELFSFHGAILNDLTPVVSGLDGKKALEVAYQILDTIRVVAG